MLSFSEYHWYKHTNNPVMKIIWFDLIQNMITQTYKIDSLYGSLSVIYPSSIWNRGYKFILVRFRLIIMHRWKQNLSGWDPICLMLKYILYLCWHWCCYESFQFELWVCCDREQVRVGTKICCYGYIEMLEWVAGWTRKYVGWFWDFY